MDASLREDRQQARSGVHFAEDERSSDPEVLSLVAAVGERVPAIDELVETIGSALEELEEASDPGARKSLSAQMRASVERYRAELEADPFLIQMETTEAGSFAIHSALSEALSELEDALAA